jgi:hypothetical protein
MSAVAEVGFFFTVVVLELVEVDVVRTPADDVVDVDDVVWAETALANPTASASDRPSVVICFIVLSIPCSTPNQVRGSPSGRISGVVKVTPSSEGFGVGVTAVCGEPATPVRSWIRISIAKSSCTVL